MLAIVPLAPAAEDGVVRALREGGSKGGQFGLPPNPPTLGFDVNNSGAGAGADPGDLYVADRNNNRVQQFDADGNFKRAFGLDVIINSGAPPNSNGTGYEVCDTTTNPPNRPDDCKAGLTGGIGGAMNAPLSVAVDEVDGSVYVYDAANLRIQKFTSDGHFVWAAGRDVTQGAPVAFEVCGATEAAQCKAGASGALGGELGAHNVQVVKSLAVDPSNQTLYLVDPPNKRVQELDADGSFIRAIGWDVDSGNPSTAYEECTDQAMCKSGVGAGAGDGPGQFGGSLAAAGAQGPTGISVAEDGAVYVADTGLTSGRQVHKLTPQVDQTFEAEVFGPGLLSNPAAVAVATSSDSVYVAREFSAGSGNPPAPAAEKRVVEVDPTGTEIRAVHLALRRISTLNHISVPEPGMVQISTSDALPNLDMLGCDSSSLPPDSVLLVAGIYTFGDVEQPEMEISAVEPRGAGSALVEGMVKPNGGGMSTMYRIEYSLTGSTWNELTACLDGGRGTGPSPFSIEVEGLPGNQPTIRLRGSAWKPYVGVTRSEPVTSSTEAAPPHVATGRAWWIGPSELAVSGSVNPQSSQTDYWIEYGTTPALGRSQPAGGTLSAGEGFRPKRVIEAIFDTPVDQEIYYRVVASNAVGRTNGEIRSIPARSASRVIEYVTQDETNGLGAGGQAVSSIEAISDDGRRVVVGAQTLGDPIALPSQYNRFPVQLTTDGWRSERFGPDPANGSTTALSGLWAFSDDLGTALISQRTTIEGLGQEARWVKVVAGGDSDYASAPLIPLEREGPITRNQGAAFELQASSKDFSAFAFKKILAGPGAYTYIPGEPLVRKGYANSLAVNIYRVGPSGPDADAELANIGPGGTPIANVCGAWIGAEEKRGRGLLRAMSEDGRVLYFSARPSAPTSGSTTECNDFVKPGFPLRIYKRVNGQGTVMVGECRKSPPATCEEMGDDIFWGASGDGDVVVFTTTRQLVDEDQDATSDLYVYDASPPGGQPELVLASAGESTPSHPDVGKGAVVDGVVESAMDGSRVYFVASGQLTTDAPAAGPKLFVYERNDERPAGTIKFITALPPGDKASLWGDGASGQFHFAEVLPLYKGGSTGELGDGRWLVFSTTQPIAPEDTDGARDVYRYDALGGSLICVSCKGAGEADAQIRGRGQGQGGAAFAMRQGRTASEDASRIVFATTEALVPEDANGALDAYEWSEDAGVVLISAATGDVGIAGGTGNASTAAFAMSPTGERVFFGTKARLHPGDQNSAVDVYAASSQAGFSVDRPGGAGCSSDASCRPNVAQGDSPPGIGTEGLVGRGNLRPARGPRCKASQVRRGKRCIAKVVAARRACARKKGKAKRRCVRAKVRQLNRGGSASYSGQSGMKNRGGDR